MHWICTKGQEINAKIMESKIFVSANVDRLYPFLSYMYKIWWLISFSFYHMCINYTWFAFFGRNERESYIFAKYDKKKFVINTNSSEEEIRYDLKQAIQTRDFQTLLQIHGEGTDLMSVMPDMVKKIHIYCRLEGR